MSMVSPKPPAMHTTRSSATERTGVSRVACGLPVIATLLVMGCAVTALAEPSAYERGLQALAEKRDADAVAPLQEALALAETPAERAEIGLLLGVVLNWCGQHDAAIAELERVLEYDPHLRHDYPSVKIWALNPQVMLGYAYRDKGDLNAAIASWERYLTWRIDSPATTVNDMVARRTLTDDGQLRAPPMVHRSGYGFIPSVLDGETQRLLVPAARLGQALGAECTLSDDGAEATLAIQDGATVRVEAGVQHATVDGERRAMETSARLIEDELWVPLRFVAEALGHSIEWEAAPRIAWVR